MCQEERIEPLLRRSVRPKVPYQVICLWNDSSGGTVIFPTKSTLSSIDNIYRRHKTVVLKTICSRRKGAIFWRYLWRTDYFEDQRQLCSRVHTARRRFVVFANFVMLVSNRLVNHIIITHFHSQHSPLSCFPIPAFLIPSFISIHCGYSSMLVEAFFCQNPVDYSFWPACLSFHV